jgi:putative acetyltransferase
LAAPTPLNGKALTWNDLRLPHNYPMPSFRPEQPPDIPAIRAIHAGSFPTDAEARLVDLLRETGALSVSLVAEVSGVAVGHVAFSPVQVASGCVGAGLAPVAVLPSFRRQGIAASLIQAGLAECYSAGFRWAVVLGSPAYYARFGFQPAANFGLTDEYGGGNAFQVVALVPGGIPSNEGLVRYALPFASLS